jgi:hypothetical protein
MQFNRSSYPICLWCCGWQAKRTWNRWSRAARPPGLCVVSKRIARPLWQVPGRSRHDRAPGGSCRKCGSRAHDLTSHSGFAAQWQSGVGGRTGRASGLSRQRCGLAAHAFCAAIHHEKASGSAGSGDQPHTGILQAGFLSKTWFASCGQHHVPPALLKWLRATARPAPPPSNARLSPGSRDRRFPPP